MTECSAHLYYPRFDPDAIMFLPQPAAKYDRISRASRAELSASPEATTKEEFMFRKLSPSVAILLTACFCLALAATSVSAQSQATSGTSRPRVSTRRAVVPARPSPRLLRNRPRKNRHADNKALPLNILPPGSYTVRANGPGFAQTELRDVAVTVVGGDPVDVNLSVSGSSETVTSRATADRRDDRTSARPPSTSAHRKSAGQRSHYLTSRRSPPPASSATRRARAISPSAAKGEL